MGKLATHVYHNYGITTVGDSSSNEWCWKAKGEMFPVIINYFTIESGIVRSVLEVVEQPLESAENITNTIHDILKKHNLDIQKLTSVGTNNANTNYG
ncbi:unnamed protein product [Rotaria sordida]|uniref:Uncharacterized protein n=1 Tax=Rotaria sordida TaxID=392033 RepID=A0A814GKJ7_9BILA|nr:unnamed protein product [Rotaria sordida]